MKITIDTNDIKFPRLSLREYTDREVFFVSLLIVLFGYLISDYIDSMRFTRIEDRVGRVEVTLDKVVNEIQTRSFDKSRDLDVKESTKILQSQSGEWDFVTLFNSKQKIKLNAKQFDCLARNIYWEALREPLIGQIAVANVTHNRLISGKWGHTFCDVVFAPKQFSWTNNQKIRNAQPKNKKQWDRAKHSAMLFSNGVRVNKLYNTQFYYAEYIRKPKWANRMTKDAKIGQHIFYTKLD
jgi:N-acetylmuramoyl-L-alanine amidase